MIYTLVLDLMTNLGNYIHLYSVSMYVFGSIGPRNIIIIIITGPISRYLFFPFIQIIDRNEFDNLIWIQTKGVR